MSEPLQEGPPKQFDDWTVLPPDVIDVPRNIISDVDIREEKAQ
jgi:hypothetical protein